MEEAITLSRRQPSLIKEGHYTIRAHPGDVYLGFALPKSGTGENIATAVIDYLESVGVSTADTEILGVNTGHLNGSMRNMDDLYRELCDLPEPRPFLRNYAYLRARTAGHISDPIRKLFSPSCSPRPRPTLWKVAKRFIEVSILRYHLQQEPLLVGSTLMEEAITLSRRQPSLIKEGHYTIRAHPGDVYLGFAVPKSGTGENTATAVIDYLESVGVSTADTEILGVNTGHLNGSMRNMDDLYRELCARYARRSCH